MKRIVGVSGGKDSTAMALRLKEVEPEYEYVFAITPTGRELPPMIEHWERLGKLLGQPLFRIPGPTLDELIVKFGMVPNHWARWCTRLVKIEPFMQYVKSVAPATTCIGIRADEPLREGTDWKGFETVVQDFPLHRWGWGIQEVTDYLRDREIVIPKRTDCDMCFFQRLIEWYEFWLNYPDRWMYMELREKGTGHTLRSDQRDTWPASMEGLRKEFESGRIPKDTRKDQARKTMCSWCAR